MTIIIVNPSINIINQQNEKQIWSKKYLFWKLNLPALANILRTVDSIAFIIRSISKNSSKQNRKLKQKTNENPPYAGNNSSCIHYVKKFRCCIWFYSITHSQFITPQSVSFCVPLLPPSAKLYVIWCVYLISCIEEFDLKCGESVINGYV